MQGEEGERDGDADKDNNERMVCDFKNTDMISDSFALLSLHPESQEEERSGNGFPFRSFPAAAAAPSCL